MALRIEELFHVAAPVDTVWRYLIDPSRVVQCLPGAELTEAQGDRTFLGRVKLKVGPVVASYNGKATLTEVNEADHLVRITAEGKESGGAGSARMTMTSRVTATAAGGSDVHVEAELDVAGKIVQFGRGMIETVNKQLFRQFTECVKQTLEVAEAPPEATPSGANAAAPLPAASVAGPRSAQPTQPVRLIPLLLHAIWVSILRMFGKSE